jgi:hypothetical protein
VRAIAVVAAVVMVSGAGAEVGGRETPLAPRFDLTDVWSTDSELAGDLYIGHAGESQAAWPILS